MSDMDHVFLLKFLGMINKDLLNEICIKVFVLFPLYTQMHISPFRAFTKPINMLKNYNLPIYYKEVTICYDS